MCFKPLIGESFLLALNAKVSGAGEHEILPISPNLIYIGFQTPLPPLPFTQAVKEKILCLCVCVCGGGGCECKFSHPCFNCSLSRSFPVDVSVLYSCWPAGRCLGTSKNCSNFHSYLNKYAANLTHLHVIV